MMAKWRVIGVDSVSGKGRSVEVDASSAKGAQMLANDMGIMVERVDPAIPGQDVDKSELAVEASPKKKKQAPDIYESVTLRASPKRKHVRFFGVPVPYFGESKRKYDERGVNTIGEMAAAVFLGLLAFSCISPVVFLYILIFMVVWGSAIVPPR